MNRVSGYGWCTGSVPTDVSVPTRVDSNLGPVPRTVLNPDGESVLLKRDVG